MDFVSLAAPTQSCFSPPRPLQEDCLCLHGSNLQPVLHSSSLHMWMEDVMRFKVSTSQNKIRALQFMREHLVREVAAFYLLPLGRHNIQFVHLGFRALYWIPRSCSVPEFRTFTRLSLNLWVKYNKPLKKTVMDIKCNIWKSCMHLFPSGIY